MTAVWSKCVELSSEYRKDVCDALAFLNSQLWGWYYQSFGFLHVLHKVSALPRALSDKMSLHVAVNFTKTHFNIILPPKRKQTKKFLLFEFRTPSFFFCVYFFRPKFQTFSHFYRFGYPDTYGVYGWQSSSLCNFRFFTYILTLPSFWLPWHLWCIWKAKFLIM